MVALIAGLAWTTAYQVARFAWIVAAEFDRAQALAELAPRPQSTVVFDRYGEPAFTFYVEQRIDVPLERVAPAMIEALLAVEDQRFFRHGGIDPVRIAGAAWNNVKAGRVVQGGSTITQQLARAAQLSPRRTFDRKLREALLAARLERRYSKREILEAYLNTVYFGEGYYGVEAASRGYFGKPASALEPAEAALLAAVVRAPSHDAPCVSPQRALARRNLVLRLMKKQGRLTEEAYGTASAMPIPDASHEALAGSRSFAAADGAGLYFQEELRRQLVAQFGSERVLRGGLRVFSTYDPVLQKAAEEAVRWRIAAIAKGHRGARALQGALVTIDPSSGDVLALVGGRDFAASSFNRATQARRQAGSAFKPIVFAAALERGLSPGTLLTDLGRAIGSGREAWLPGGEHEHDTFTLRRALQVSSNRAAAQLLQQIGTSATAYYAQRLGVTSTLPLVPSLALGTGEVTLLELTASYTAFANGGVASMPRLYTRVEQSNGAVIHFTEPRQTRALSEATAYLMSSMLAGVVSGGTAHGVRAAGFRLPAAGKTGTTDDYTDAWFIGYTPKLVTGVWFGLDRPAPIMSRGFAGIVAVPAWARFMKAATEGHKAEWFKMPSTVERVTICRRTGARATPACRYHVEAVTQLSVTGVIPAHYVQTGPPMEAEEPPVYDELFAIGTLSSEPCPLHSAPVMSISDSDLSSTPLVDSALIGSRPVRRIVGTDGVVRYVR